MNRTHLAYILIGLAGILAIGLIGWEVYTRLPTQVAEPQECRLKEHRRLADSRTEPGVEKLLWSRPTHFVSYNSRIGRLRFYRWSVDPDISWSMVSEKSLFCDKPDYHCILRKTADDREVQIDVVAFTPPYGLVEISIDGELQKSLPFSWDSGETIRIGHPLQMCQASIVRRDRELLFTTNHLLVHDRLRSLIGTFPLRGTLNGAVLKSAAKEPDLLFQMAQDGNLLPGSCAGPSNLASEFQVLSHGPWLAIKTPDGKPVLYEWGKSLTRLPLVSERVLFLGTTTTDDLVFIFSENKIHLLSNKDRVLTELSTSPPGPLTSRDPLWFWKERQQFVRYESRKWFSPKSLFIDKGPPLQWDYRFFRRIDKKPSLHIINSTRAVLINQDEGATPEFSLVECSLPNGSKDNTQ